MSTARREKKWQKRGRKPGPGITFGRTWTATSDVGNSMLALNEKLSKARRLEALAQQYMTNYGHASIPPGEAEGVLFGKTDDNAQRSVRRLIQELREAGLFAPTSTRQCIVFPAERVQRGTGRDKSCYDPDHVGHQHHRWYRGEWEYVDYETGEVEDPGQYPSTPRTESVRSQHDDQQEHGIALDSSHRRGSALLAGPGHRTSRRHRGRRMSTR